MGKIQCVNGSNSWTSWMDQLDGPAGQTSWTDQFFYLKSWPVCIFEDFPFSLYIVAASESDEGLVFIFVTISGEGLEGKKVLSDGKHWLLG